MSILSNPWVIGISGSIIASVIYTFIMNFFSRKILNVERANSEITTLLIMSTAEGKLPNQEVVKALINATAKKYSVSINDINALNDIYDDLIRVIY